MFSLLREAMKDFKRNACREILISITCNPKWFHKKKVSKDESKLTAQTVTEFADNCIKLLQQEFPDDAVDLRYVMEWQIRGSPMIHFLIRRPKKNEKLKAITL